jgi:hypothetical protein
MLDEKFLERSGRQVHQNLVAVVSMENRVNQLPSHIGLLADEIVELAKRPEAGVVFR